MKRRWMVIALAVSLVANVALVGFLAGAASRPALWSRSLLDPAVGLTQLLRFLPDERRETVLRDALVDRRELRRRVGASVRDMRRAQRTLHRALTAQPFDPDAVTDVLADFREHFAASQTGSHSAFVAVAERLTPEERRRFVRSVEGKRRNRGRPPKHLRR